MQGLEQEKALKKEESSIRAGEMETILRDLVEI